MRKLLMYLVGMIAFMQAARSQNVDISGKVADDKGNPISGVTIQEKNSKKGTTSDASGLFKVSVKTGYHTYLFQCGLRQTTGGNHQFIFSYRCTCCHQPGIE